MKYIGLLLLRLFVAVEGWSCVSRVTKVFKRVNTVAVLNFDLSGYINQQTVSTLTVKYHDNSIRAVIGYNSGAITYSKGSGVDVTADLSGNIVFTIQNVKAEDAGIYYITSTSTPTKCSCLYILGTPTKPAISVDNPSVGGRATLLCRSTSTTTPSNHSLGLIYSWRVNNIENPSGPRYMYSTNKDTLTLSNIVKEDANKQFTCTATEDVSGGYISSRSDSVQLNVLYGPENVDFIPITTNYEKAENTNLGPVTCTANCNPACSFQWNKIDDTTVVSNSAVLDLGMLSSSKAGTYRCTATRSGGSATKDLTVSVIYGPRSTFVSPNTTTYRYNENVNPAPITCGSSCWLCQYSWTGPDSFTSSGAVLDLGSLTRTMHGQYTCTATNTKYSIQRQQQINIKIEVRYGPDMAEISVNSPYTVTEGKVPEDISCSSDCYPGCSYRWINLTSGSEISADDVLSLRTMTRYMAGTYKCTVSNTAASVYKKTSENTTTVIVRYAPDVSVHIFPTNTTEDANVTLFCNGQGVPPEYHYTGLTQSVNGIQIPNSNKELTGTQKYSSIHFPSLRFEDTGLYTCKMNNNVTSTSGVLDQTTSVNVSVKVLPKVLTDNCRFAGVTGGNSHIEIPVYSLPELKTVTVTQYNGVKIKQDDKHNFSLSPAIVLTTFYGTSVTLNGSVYKMTIRNLKEDDFGNYSITLTNELGSMAFQILIFAEAPPSPPRSFRFLSDYKIPIFIWEKNFNGGLAQTFILQTSAPGTDQWINATHIPETDLQYKINDTFYKAEINLQPGVYKARIIASNAVGESEAVELGFTFEISNEEGSTISRFGNSETCTAACSSVGVVCVVLAIYAITVTILWRRSLAGRGKYLNGVQKPEEKLEQQMTYVNLTFKPSTTVNQEYTEESQYTSLEQQSRGDDKTTYDVLHAM